MKRSYLIMFLTLYAMLQICIVTGCSEDDSPGTTGPTGPTGPEVAIWPHSVWQASSDNPAIAPRPDNWDSDYTSAAEIILFNDTLRMWYEGSSGLFDVPMHLGYAWSLDGRNWNVLDAPVMKATSGEWDYPHLGSPNVYVDGDTLRMWYGAGTYNAEGMAIGYATSVDGVNWERHGKVISSGASWNPGGVLPGPVLKEEGVYKMWLSGGFGHIGQPNESTYWAIGYATSTDGIHWDVSSLPVMLQGSAGSFDVSSVLAGTVMNADSAYVMYYTGINRTNNFSAAKPAMAISTDGITWEKYENNPILQKSSASDALYFPKVREFNGQYIMWYAAWHPGPFVHAAIATN